MIKDSTTYEMQRGIEVGSETQGVRTPYAGVSTSMPLVSVITLTYNKFERLFDTVQSVLLQDYPNIEYVICDDGSRGFPHDELLQFIEANGRDGIRVRVILNPRNVGTVRNANVAFKASEGEYVMPLSCGDVFFDEGVVSAIVERFEDRRASVIVCSRLLYEGRFEPVCLLPHYVEREIIQRLETARQQYHAFVSSRYYDMASGSAMYYTRSALEGVGYFDERYTLWEDGPFLERYLWESKLEFAYDIVSIWYENGGVSTAKTRNRLLVEDCNLFSQSDLMKHVDLLPRKEAVAVRYAKARSEAVGLAGTILVLVKYLPRVISNQLYKLSRRAHIKSDAKEMKCLLGNHARTPSFESGSDASFGGSGEAPSLRKR